jgi:7,8-dihydropterin-6-yl-methyl-4-(beta-D-ribofuranosyl)aminobenzene 5'-phosphate synthase
MLVRILLVIGLLISLSAGCASGAGPPVSDLPTETVSLAPITGQSAEIPATIIPEKKPKRTPQKPSPAITENMEATVGKNTSATELLTITIVYDNNTYDERLKSAWGFSALVDYHDHTLLFDTGGDGRTLLENMRILGIDPTKIESILLSHTHSDHTGGLGDLLALGAYPSVYLPPSFSASYKKQIGKVAQVIEVTPGLRIAEGMYTTGEMGRSVLEQALVIQTDQGLVIVTGCAHPGIVEIVEKAKTLFDGHVYLVVGGFHLGSESKDKVNAIVEDFRHLGVEKVAPCHCTGDEAIAMFADEYGEDFWGVGAGRVIAIPGGVD